MEELQLKDRIETLEHEVSILIGQVNRVKGIAEKLLLLGVICSLSILLLLVGYASLNLEVYKPFLETIQLLLATISTLTAAFWGKIRRLWKK